jgi:ankyrin repeat protein
MLIDHGGDFDSRGSSDTTPLMVAVYHDQLPCTTLLLARGANVNLQAINCATALHIAANKGLSQHARALIMSGAKLMHGIRIGVHR